jgi:anti-sigma B factor antagonist
MTMTPSAPGELSVEISIYGQTANVALTGELDIATAPALEQKLSRLPREGVARVMLDMRALSFIDSTGLRVVLGLADGLTLSSAGVVIIRGPEAVQRVFALTGADRELVMIDDPSELDGLDARA